VPRKLRPQRPSVPPFLWDILSTPALTTLLATLQAPSAPDHAAARAVVDVWLAHGRAAAMAALQVHAGSLDPAVHVALDWLVTTFATTPHASRLKRCVDPQCQQFFFDGTKNNNQQWCSPRRHRTVRNRQRQRASRARHRQNPPEAHQPPG
jgi:predicted RNA-binding Zn ribbon-like protein